MFSTFKMNINAYFLFADAKLITVLRTTQSIGITAVRTPPKQTEVLYHEIKRSILRQSTVWYMYDINKSDFSLKRRVLITLSFLPLIRGIVSLR